MKSIYEGLVLTTIKLEGELKHDKAVTFNEKDGNDKAVFIKDIREDDKRFLGICGKRQFRATYVSVEKIKEAFEDEVKKTFGENASTDIRPLFYVHGWLAANPCRLLKKEMKTALQRCREAGRSCYPIPVVWPTAADCSLCCNPLRRYNVDQDKVALEAGKILKVFVRVKNSLDRKSLMCHSMGNHMVFNGILSDLDGETPNIQFENIFFVAADIPSDVFSQSPREIEFKNTKQKAQNLTGMLKDGGKIYVLHTREDWVLGVSKIINNWTTPGGHAARLGKHGATSGDLDPTLAKFVSNEDVTARVNEGLGGPLDRFVDRLVKLFVNPVHNYQWEPWAVRFYGQPS